MTLYQNCFKRPIAQNKHIIIISSLKIGWHWVLGKKTKYEKKDKFLLSLALMLVRTVNMKNLSNHMIFFISVPSFSASSTFITLYIVMGPTGLDLFINFLLYTLNTAKELIPPNIVMAWGKISSLKRPKEEENYARRDIFLEISIIRWNHPSTHIAYSIFQKIFQISESAAKLNTLLPQKSWTIFSFEIITIQL